MPINVQAEKIVPLRSVPDLPFITGRRGRRISIATIYRWIERERDPLETIKIGGTRCTSVEAVLRFIEASNAKTRTPRVTFASNRRSERAAMQLARLGM